MQRDLAGGIIEHLGAWDVLARLTWVAPTWFAVRVPFGHDGEAVWDIGAPWGLGAQIHRSGRLVGFIPVIPGSDTDLSAMELALLIARSDYVLDVLEPAYPIRTCARS